MGNQTDNQHEYSFLYLKKPQSQLARWTRKNKELQEFGKMEYFAGILCPVSTANVEVFERTRAEYDTIEFVILKLFASGLQSVENLSSIMGLEKEMVKNVLSVLENTYHHISGTQITDEGRQSLNDGKNIQCYKTTKQVQFEAITGTVLLPVLFQSMSGIEAYYFTRNQESVRRIMPKHYIERDVRSDIMTNFDHHRKRGTIERNVESIINVSVEDCTYTEAFLVKYDYLPHPFIILPVQGSKSVTWIPVAVSASSEKVLKKEGFEFDYYNFDLVVRPDSEFEPLVQLQKEYGLDVSPEKLEKTFTLGEKTFELSSPDNEAAELRVHPQTGFTPVFCVEKEQPKNVTEKNNGGLTKEAEKDVEL